MFTNKPVAILYLDRGFFLYFDTNKRDIIQVDFSAFSSNVEIYKRNELEESIFNFIKENKLTPGELFIILAESTLFLKGLPQGIEDVDFQIKQFSDNIPFDHVTTKSYDIGQGVLIVSTNKDYFGIIAKVFERNGYLLQAVTPVISLPIDFSSGFSHTVAQKLSGNLQSMKQNSFELSEKPQHTLLIGIQPQKDYKKSDKKRLYILSGVFGILIVILIIVFFLNAESLFPKRAKRIQSSASQLAPVVTKSEQTSANTKKTITSKDVEQLQVKIIASSQATSLASSIKKELQENDFQKIEEVLNDSLSSNSVIITFSPSVPSTIRDQIFTLKSFPPDTIIQENTSADADIIISLPK